jgi:Family of unknown function (DUF5752)
MSPYNGQVGPFIAKDCALVGIATGMRAQNLRELRDNLLRIHPGSIYYHFWGALLRPRFDDPQYNNDFAVWCHYALHDDPIAERLAIIDPTDFEDLEALRQELVDVIEERLEEIERIPWSDRERQFHFLRSQIVVFDTGIQIDKPEGLVEVVPRLPVGSIFYHFIDGRRREPKGIDDFRAWLDGFGDEYTELHDRLAAIDPYFASLTNLRKELAGVFKSYFGKVVS